MAEDPISQGAAQIKARIVPGGGFAPAPQGDYRPDATCWAILALMADPAQQAIIQQARTRLAAGQLADGRVSISPEHPEAWWPTALAILAWHRSPEHQSPQARAIHFLLTTTGRHWPRPADSPVAHDTDIAGWSWIAQTHSWVEPTSMAMLALQITGYGDHPRVQEAGRMLLDRQLPQGGWNYGNTLVYDQELRPMPLSTGMALNALHRRTSRATIQRSLAYLQARAAGLHTPRSLGWSLLGLGAWQARPEPAPAWIPACLARQAQYGAYDTPSLAVLLVAARSPGGLEAIFSEPWPKAAAPKG